MKRLNLMCIALAAGALLASPVGAADPLSDQELDANRGGFILVDGWTLDFGAVIKSYVNDELVLRTDVTLSSAGLQGVQTGAAPAALPDGLLSSLAAAGVNLSGLSGGTATVSADGATAFIHQFGDGQITNFLVNTGSDRTLRQETELTLTLPGFQDVQAAMTQALTANDLAAAVNRATSF